MTISGTRAGVSCALLTDLYELTMVQAYVEEAMTEQSTFSLFVRTLPPRRNFLLACGLDDTLRVLEELRFDDGDVAYLASLGTFSERALRYLERFRFAGDVYAVPEGTPVFAGEPLLEIVAPLPQAQLVESIVINQMHLQTVLASKAARVVLAARGRGVVDFGLRRMHGIDAAVKAPRAFFVAGVDATSNVAAGELYAMPISGTMAHSYVQAHDGELEAFRSFTRRYPEGVLLVDTYDALEGVRNVVALARELGPEFRVRAIRLDSGDLAGLAAAARGILDDAGLGAVEIFASGGLDEDAIDALVRGGAPIDGFGVGTELGVASDAPALDVAYKLVAYAGRGRLKLSPGKPTLPGRKQVFRFEEDGIAVRDVIARHDEEHAARPLLRQVMRDGVRLPAGREPLTAARERARAAIASLPVALRGMAPAAVPYPVEVSVALAVERDRLAAAVRGGSRP